MSKKTQEKVRKILVQLSLLKENSELPIKTRLALIECFDLCESLYEDLGMEKSHYRQESFSLELSQKVPVEAKILIVDDDEDIQRMLRFILQKKGFDVISKLDPVEAFSELNEIKPDVILLDLMMPGMTGFEFLHQLQNSSLKGKIKIIVCSSRNFERDRITVLEEGAHDFISKPYNIAELVLKLRNILPQSLGTVS